MSGSFRPYRSLRSELVALSFVVLVPVALLSVFPFAALRPLPPTPSRTPVALCAFVTLTPAEERKAMADARTAWQVDRGNQRIPRIDLFADSLPALPWQAVIGDLPRTFAGRRAPEPYAPDPLPPTLASPPPATIAPQPDAGKCVPAFSREELLRLNYRCGD